jgi:hypothetical protein
MSVIIQMNGRKLARPLVGRTAERLSNEGAGALVFITCEGSDSEIRLGVRSDADVELLRVLVDQAEEIIAAGRKELEGVDLCAERQRIEELDSERRDNRRWADCIRGTER